MGQYRVGPGVVWQELGKILSNTPFEEGREAEKIAYLAGARDLAKAIMEVYEKGKGQK